MTQGLIGGGGEGIDHWHRENGELVARKIAGGIAPKVGRCAATATFEDDFQPLVGKGQFFKSYGGGIGLEGGGFPTNWNGPNQRPALHCFARLVEQ